MLYACAVARKQIAAKAKILRRSKEGTMSTDPVSHGDLSRIINAMVDDPTRYQDFVEAWDQHLKHTFDDLDSLLTAPESARDNTDLNRTAEAALTNLAQRDRHNEIRADIGQMLNRFPHSAILVEDGGAIVASNDIAFTELRVDVGDRVDALGLTLFEAEPLVDVIGSVARSRDENQSVMLKRAYRGTANNALTLAMVRSNTDRDAGDLIGAGNAEPKGAVLLFLIDPVWHAEAARLLQRAFGLTDSEIAVTRAFMAGDSLRSIAQSRERSLATVRTQFQSILEKTGATSQIDLMRVAMGLSQFITQIEPITQSAARPADKRVDMLRPHGRSVDVLFFGAAQGTPVVYLHSLFTRRFTPHVERRLEQAGLRMIGIGRPGFGRTDPPLEGQSVFDCFADDFEAALDQLELDKDVLLGQTSSAHLVFDLRGRLSHRVDRAMMLGTAAPVQFVDMETIGSRWTSALAKACKVSPQMALLIARSGHRLMKTIGTRRFMARFYGSSQVDREVMTREDITAEIEAGLGFTLHQGMLAAVADVSSCFEDWSDYVRASRHRVVLFHGAEDPHAPLASIRRFAESFPHQTQLVALEQAGQSTAYTHTDLLISWLKNERFAPELP